MKTVKKSAFLLVAMLLCIMLAVPALAEGTGSIWITMEEATNGAVAQIITDTTVVDGLLEVHYDSSKLHYEGVEVNGDYVAMYAVNADEAGIVRISWVAPGEYEADASGLTLIQVQFSGSYSSGAASLSGSATDSEGNEVSVADNGASTPSESSEPTTPPASTEAPSTNNPKEGDSSQLWPVAVLMVCAAAAVIVLVFARKRRAKK